MLRSHGRFEYSPIVARPDFSWPGGQRLAVYIALCMEHFSYGESGLGLSYSPGIPHPNTYNWAWREYGNRVGGWRLLEMFEQAGRAANGAPQHRVLRALSRTGRCDIGPRAPSSLLMAAPTR